MIDRELELAALAAGYVPVRLTDDGTALLLEGVQQPWNPRDENPHSDCMGDALRLAVELGLVIYMPDDDDMTVVVRTSLLGSSPRFMEECRRADPYAATSRAIVRAAAAIGASMAGAAEGGGKP